MSIYQGPRLLSLLPATDWQGVYWYREQHTTMPLHALALAQLASPGDDWDIVGLVYDPTNGWTMCDEDVNFCGFLPPGFTLTDFVAHSACAHLHPKERRDASAR